MCGHVMKLALAASLTFAGVALAAEQGPITMESISPAISSSAFSTTNSGRSGFGFSPFQEEQLVGQMPPARHRDLRGSAPPYLRDFRGVADAP